MKDLEAIYTKKENVIRKELALVRAIRIEGSSETQEEHYDLKRSKARMKLTEILYIFSASTRRT